MHQASHNFSLNKRFSLEVNITCKTRFEDWLAGQRYVITGTLVCLCCVWFKGGWVITRSEIWWEWEDLRAEEECFCFWRWEWETEILMMDVRSEYGMWWV